jgi:hypothetical protein
VGRGPRRAWAAERIRVEPHCYCRFVRHWELGSASDFTSSCRLSESGRRILLTTPCLSLQSGSKFGPRVELYFSHQRAGDTVAAEPSRPFAFWLAGDVCQWGCLFVLGKSLQEGAREQSRSGCAVSEDGWAQQGPSVGSACGP